MKFVLVTLFVLFAAFGSIAPQASPESLEEDSPWPSRNIGRQHNHPHHNRGHGRHVHPLAPRHHVHPTADITNRPINRADGETLGTVPNQNNKNSSFQSSSSSSSSHSSSSGSSQNGKDEPTNYSYQSSQTYSSQSNSGGLDGQINGTFEETSVSSQQNGTNDPVIREHHNKYNF